MVSVSASKDKKWKWFYEPRDIPIEQSVTEFSDLFDGLIKKYTSGRNIILPLSGGLDSRTIAASLKGRKDVVAISYQFEGGIQETRYAKQIADTYGWEFHSFNIPKGYLWSVIDELSKINKCQTEFTHPRQMAIINEICNYGDLIISGQWGDVLFDTPGLSETADLNMQTNYILKYIAKPGGIELASSLWKYWDLDGQFNAYFLDSIYKILKEINIRDSNSCIKAFKSQHWATRWANENLKVFSSHKDVYVPYYDDDMCKFVCTIPNDHLAGREIQIRYLKQKAPELAKIPWQSYNLDLFNYKYFNTKYFPRRVYQYALRNFRERVLKKAPVIQRNWELQFIGKYNEENLNRWLFETPELDELIPRHIVSDYYKRFKKFDSIRYSHPVSMILTLAVWSKRFWVKK